MKEEKKTEIVKDVPPEKEANVEMIFDDEEETASMPVEKNDTEVILQAKDPEPLYHEVMPQETLYGLSKKYHVQTSDLQKWNALDNNDIKIGQKLIVGYQ